MKITHEHVRHIAELSRLELSEEEISTFASQLDAILAHVAQLEQVDTAEVEGMTHAVELACPLREDTARPSLPRDEVLDQAPERDAEHFLVPQVIE